MSKVETLLQEINDTLEDTANSLNPAFHRDYIGLDETLDSLIAAARAEGAEQMVQKILASAEFVPENQCTDGFAEYDEYVFPASTLSPAPKEDEQDNTTEEEYEDMRRNGGPEVKP